MGILYDAVEYKDDANLYEEYESPTGAPSAEDCGSGISEIETES